MDILPLLLILGQILLIDLVLAGDNAIIIGLAVARLPLPQRRKAILAGIAGATVIRIVRKHGGSVWAQGEEDKGAQFFFTL